MKRFIPRLGVNPIIVKELRSRMRGPRAFITLTIILVLTGGIMFAILQIVLATSRYSTILSPQVGQGMFAALAFLELFMIATITPAVTAGAISSEKEKQTYEMLMTTPLSPARILWGKLISAMSYVFLLLFAAVPLASVVFIFGGVAPREMLKVLMVLLVIAGTLGVVGLFMSALFGRTGWATVASYVTVVLITLGPIFIAVLIGVLRQAEPPRWILAPSPISALSAALSSSMGQTSSFSQFFYILSGIWNLGNSPISQTEIPRPLYHYSLPFYAGFSLVLYLITMRLVQPTRRFKIRSREVLIAAVVILGFCGILALGFLLTANRYEWALKGKSTATGIEPVVVSQDQAFAQSAYPASQVVEVQPVALDATLTPAEPPGASSETSLDIEAQVEIYAAVARRLYTVDHTFEDNPPNWPALYLVQVTDDGVGDPNTSRLAAVNLDEKTMSGITSALSDLPPDILWVAKPGDVSKDSTNGTVEGNGVIFTFGNIHVQPDGTVQVPASLYFSSLGGGGRTYLLTNENGVWTITGTTGLEWIS